MEGYFASPVEHVQLCDWRDGRHRLWLNHPAPFAAADEPRNQHFRYTP
ncbi:predicted protein [Streptomyces viridosporus ATCC 14672]|uniref:Predicted protein n=1 Tax=Streptomyces viridosporus (strain ATCC 14672 / DSM 40746 / JCM 4963 / KCTC 9882 / NRRL B-12104 / FH 1290) TaxID=566461 RepID=D6A8G6_STRV1|nr:predicted protein [Streptomyces viridosporus ATCC 14672]